jgi:5'-nucleotidase
LEPAQSNPRCSPAAASTGPISSVLAVIATRSHTVGMPRKILYVDLDNTLVDFRSGIDGLDPDVIEEYQDRFDVVPGIFALMRPMPGAIDAFRELAELFDTYILSTAPWLNSSAWQHKVEWVHEHLGIGEDSVAYKRLILTHHKNLNRGDFLIDDRSNNGAGQFDGDWIHFGSTMYPDWPTVVDYLRQNCHDS